MKKTLISILLLISLISPALAADRAGIMVSWLGVFAPGWQPTKAGYEGGCITAGDFDRDQFKAFIHQARYYGANGFRAFPYETKWVKSFAEMFSPVLWDAGKKAWDLDRWNEKYFLALDDLIAICELNRIKVWFSLFDNCQTHAGRNKLMAPWLNNVQGIANYLRSQDYAKRWVNKIVGRYGNRINYEICNEFCVIAGTGPFEAGNWLAQMADAVLRSGVPPENICWGAEPIGAYVDGQFEIDKDRDLTVLASRALSNMTNPLTGKLYRDDADRAQDRIYCTIHNIGVLAPDPKDERIAIQCWGNARTRKAILSDDGQSVGHSLLNREEDGGWSRGNYQETFDSHAYLMRNDGNKPWKWIFESLPSNTAPPAWLDNVKAMAAAYHQRFGVWPDNYGTPDPVYTPPPPAPEPPPGTDPEPAPLPLPSPQTGLLGLLVAALLAFWRRIVVLYRTRGRWWWWLVLFGVLGLLIVLVF